MEGKVVEQQIEPVQKSNQTSTPIKVYVRVRPVRGVEISCVSLVDNDTIELGIQRVFRFDRIYGPTSSQVDVYSTSVFPLVCKFFEGINCTIFAYGQTGSGKTYTIGSGCYHGEEREGIIARTVSDIFKCIESSDSVKRLLSVSYLEIYKEELRDLLQDNSYSANKEIIIREDDCGRTIISGMVEEEVRSIEDALGWLECGNAARVTSATEMNAHSSRSHAVFTISMVQEKTAVYNEQQLNSGLVSKFHFVDLAGSERVSRTNNAGERFKESIHINSGLLALGNVISALSDKRRRSIHVPYRDSKITRILKDSLGGSALTVMITCLSPANKDLPESLNALKYAKRARNIKNHPVVNLASDGATGNSALLYSMKEEIECLRSELDKARETAPPNSATTILTVDSSEFCGPQLFNLKAFRHMLSRQKVIQQAAEAAYNQFQSVEPSNAEGQELKNAMENLCSVIHYNTEFNGIEDMELVSKSTNTSLDYGNKQNDLDKALLTIRSLREELQILKGKLSISDQKCLEHCAKQEAMSRQYQAIVKQKTELQDEVGNLERVIDHLQGELQLVKAVDQVEEVQGNNPAMDDDKVIETFPPNIADIHSIVHGTITNWLDLDDSGCDMAMRQLTDILSSRIPAETTDSELLLANGPLPADDDVVQSFDNEIDRLNDNIVLSQHQLHDAEKRLLHAQQTMKSLGLKIRFKEELIKELVKNNSTFQCLNEAYQKKLTSMEHECDQLKHHTRRSSAQLARGGAMSHGVINDFAVSKPSNEQSKLSNSRSKRRKAKSAGCIVKGSRAELRNTESKLLTLQRKRQDTLRILKMGARSEKRVSELVGEMERLRNHQGSLKKKLKEELTRKRSLEEQVQHCRVRIMTLSESNRQQSQVIRVKTQEAATAQRKLRNYQPGSHINHLASQHWIDDQVEKIVEEKQALKAFQNELLEREAVIREQERLLQERTRLQSQCHGGPSQQIETIDQKITTKEKLKVSFSGQSLKALKDEISDLKTKRKELAEEDTSHKILSSDQKMRLMEISEQIEVFETLLQTKNNSASKMKTSQSIELVRSELENVFSKISTLPSEESKFLLNVYVKKVITLKDKLEKSRTNEAELSKQLARQEETVHGLEQSLDQSQVDKELRLTRLHKEHAKEVQILLQQITATKDEVVCDDSVAIMRNKVQQLERDLYYYKKTARDLKRQLNIKASITPQIILKDSLDEENT